MSPSPSTDKVSSSASAVAADVERAEEGAKRTSRPARKTGREEELLTDVRVLRRGSAKASSSVSDEETTDDFVKVQGKVREEPDGNRLYYFAASPPDRRQSFSGSGLPFMNADQAFDGTPNVGALSVASGGRFDIDILCPNAYYVGLGTQYVPPTLHVWYTKNGFRKDAAIKVNNGIPFRTLTYPTLPTRPRDGPMFYKPVETLARTQEQILRDSAYPSKHAIKTEYAMPYNFWGLRPPY